ncbi:DEAD/DEAH box helicase [Paenimyroides viscosum]|uniref:DEAD/DEAH box helicase n=1 Tax=Paenimyroides viscosum TaxID=2488729 RepID=A0A3P1B3R6_9FLAO|nr:DEAD/DEAH box helicase [Paenimyroides viscosum]RRA95800.1 DEAD/DEAH box helicase [Paenimyroides viscosum]
MTFESLGISKQLVETLHSNGITNPFPIQQKAIPVILEGKNLLGIAPTGSGKTAGFVLPILENRQQLNYKNSRNIPVLIVVPTRELAIQIESFIKLCSPELKRPIKSMAVYGGVAINPQMKNMIGTELLIATPGRLLDLLEQNALSLDLLETLIIDEADKMFQLGFEDELQAILKTIPKNCQHILFSATLNDKVETIKQTLTVNFETVEVEKILEVADPIDQIAYYVTPERKGPFLRYLLKTQVTSQALIFVSSTRTADNLSVKLAKNGIKTATLHSKKTQGARNQALTDFKSGAVQVLITTDILSRGIHIDMLPVVINYELPRSPLDYVHRIGRTGRANETGQAITLLTLEDMHHFKIIQKKMKHRVEVLPTDEIDVKNM